MAAFFPRECVKRLVRGKGTKEGDDGRRDHGNGGTENSEKRSKSSLMPCTDVEIHKRESGKREKRTVLRAR